MAEETLAINLKILSPSSEIEGGIHLQDVPASTTVRELRLKIQHAVPSNPGPERMRLIYRGKVVANDADSLETVFGAENIRESKDQSLHLVLREVPQPPSTRATPAPRTATAPPNPFRAAQPPLPASPPLQTNPFRTIPQPRQDSQPQAPPPHHHHHPHLHHHHHHVQQPFNPLGPMGSMPLPPQMQQQIAQALGQRGPLATPAPGTPTQQAAGAAPAPPEGAPPAALHPSLTGMPAPNGRTVHQQGVGPNGARWSVTYNDFTANMPLRPGQPTLPRPVPHPAAFGVPPRPFGSPPAGGVNVPLSWLLPRLRGTLQEAAREVDNVRTLLEPPSENQSETQSTTAPPFPSWRVERIREHLRTITHNLNMVESGLSDPAMQLNMDVIALRQAAGEVRRQANEFSRSLDAQDAAVTAALAPSTSSAAASDPLIATASAATRTLPSDAPQELFLLSSPQGPVGLLFDQRGTYTTAPFSSSLASQTFIDQFNQNRQLIANLGQHIAQGSQVLHTQLGNIQQQPAPNQQNNALDPTAAQRVINRLMQGPAQNPDQNAAPVNAPAEPDRVINIAGHLWLIFKLACFVYIFAGGGGWYRPFMLGSIALVVYLVQLGVMERPGAVVRRHFEALLPGAERLVMGRGGGGDADHAQGQAQAGVQGGGGGGQAGQRPTPEAAAARLLQQRRANNTFPFQVSWLTDAARHLERGVALFVASLWPGIGERMVHAQEERERLERVRISEEREERERLERERTDEASRADAQGDEKPDTQTQTQTQTESPDKPSLNRMQTESLSDDFMETEQGPSALQGETKGKERAEEPETQAERPGVAGVGNEAGV